MTDEGSKPEILSRIAQATAALTRLTTVWTDRSISLSSKIRLMCSLVTSIFLYACGSWTLTAELQRRIQAMEMRFLPQDTTYLIQRPCYQRGSRRQDPAGNWTTWRPSDDRKETQTAVVWSSFPFIRSGQNHLARHSERRKKTRQTEEEVGRQHQGMDRPGARQVPEGSGEQGKWRKLVVKSSVVPERPSQLGIDNNDADVCVCVGGGGGLILQSTSLWGVYSDAFYPWYPLFVQSPTSKCHFPLFCKFLLLFVLYTVFLSMRLGLVTSKLVGRCFPLFDLLLLNMYFLFWPLFFPKNQTTEGLLICLLCRLPRWTVRKFVQ